MASIALVSLQNRLSENNKDLAHARNAYDNLNDKGSKYAGEALRILMFYQELKILIERHLHIAENEDRQERMRML